MSDEFAGVVGDKLMNCSGHVNQDHFNTAKFFWNAALEKAAEKLYTALGDGVGNNIRALKEE